MMLSNTTATHVEPICVMMIKGVSKKYVNTNFKNNILDIISQLSIKFILWNNNKNL